MLALLAPLSLGAGRAAAQSGADLPADLPGREIYLAACAGCHAADGRGVDRSLVGFETPLPDFTDCGFASREPKAQWVAMAHEGGARNGFDRMMPAFGDALSLDQIERVVDYVATMCGDRSWPRGELNLPRPIHTEKAYPEDEAVLNGSAVLTSGGEVGGELVYEKRFGRRSQIEVAVPYGYVVRQDGNGTGRVAGLGDIALGVKRTFWHDVDRGSILSLGAEAKLPTGDPANGFGSGGKAVEGYLAFGRILPADGFFHLQTGGEGPTRPFEIEEIFARFAVGRTFTQDGGWGRAWSPMAELLVVRDRGEGETLLDLVPQVQVTLNRRQHIMASAGLSIPITETAGRSPSLAVYFLWDWFDGGLFDGW